MFRFCLNTWTTYKLNYVQISKNLHYENNRSTKWYYGKRSRKLIGKYLVRENWYNDMCHVLVFCFLLKKVYTIQQLYLYNIGINRTYLQADPVFFFANWMKITGFVVWNRNTIHNESLMKSIPVNILYCNAKKLNGLVTYI